jgi:glycosyltransferase involved in cell wall biosynthesis
MLNDNFYRASGITIAIQRIIKSPSFQAVDVYLAGCEKIAGQRSLQEDRSFVAADHYRCFPLMEGGVTLLRGLYSFGKWIEKMRFHVVHVHHRRLAALANLIRPFTNVPVLYTGHLTFPDSAWFRELAPRTVTGVSPSVVDYLRRCTRAVDFNLIHNPVDFPNLQVAPSTFYQRRVISVGRLEPVKGHDTLIEAWSLLKQKGIDARLDIFGEGSLRTALEAQIVDRRLEDSVSLCGFDSAIQERISDYAFNVLVSQKEGFPNVVVEAAARGIPTLLTDVDGSRDALPPQLALPNGLRYGDPHALSEALAQWLASPQLLQADGKRFYDDLKLRCSPRTVGERYLEVYLSLLGHRPPAVEPMPGTRDVQTGNTGHPSTLAPEH